MSGVSTDSKIPKGLYFFRPPFRIVNEILVLIGVIGGSGLYNLDNLTPVYVLHLYKS